MRPTHCGSLSG